MAKNRKVRKHTTILFRTATLSWLVTIITLLVFVAFTIPDKKKTFLQNLNSKARSISVSVQEITASAVVTEDYSSVVDHCLEILSGDDTVSFLIITRNDGFSLIHDHDGWRSGDLGLFWVPETRQSTGRIDTVPVLDERAYHFSWPFLSMQ